jgi:hypothetical protein
MIRPLNWRGPVTFVVTKVTKNAVSANGFFAARGLAAQIKQNLRPQIFARVTLSLY